MRGIGYLLLLTTAALQAAPVPRPRALDLSKALEGRWSIPIRKFEGEDNNYEADAEWTIEGNLIKSRRPPKYETVHWRFELDTGKSPAHIDIYKAEGSTLEFHGLLEYVDGKLRVIISDPDIAGRPRDFGETGATTIFLVLEPKPR